MNASTLPRPRPCPRPGHATPLALALSAALPLCAAVPTVRLTHPDPYANYRYPTNLLVRAAVADWEAALWRLEFRVNEQPLGVRDAPPFEWLWTHAPAGTHTLSARIQDRSGLTVAESTPVTVTVFLQNNLPMISILAEHQEAAEQGPAGMLLLWRADSHPERPLDVHVAYGMAEGFALAENGVDFQRLPSPVRFAPGSAVVRLPVYALNDGLLEGAEAFSAALTLGPGYGVSAHARAVVHIADAQVNTPTQVRLLTPAEGAPPAQVGVATPLSVALHDPDQLPHRVRLRADGRLLAEAAQIRDRVTFTHTFAFPGDFTLTAEAVDTLGLGTTSAPVTLRVRLDNLPPFVRLISPPAHTTLRRPETTLVAQAADPDGRVRSVQFWNGTNRLATVEEPVPGTPDHYRLYVSHLATGPHVFRASAIDDRGAHHGSAPVPVSVLQPPPPPPAIQLAEQPLSHSSFALGARGVLFQWDFLTPTSGNLGITNPVPATLPPGTGPLAEFASGVNPGLPISDALARQTNGEAVRWGEPYLQPGPVPRPPSVNAWRDVAAGLRRHFAIGDDGELYAWGNNSDGSLGLGTNAPSSLIVTQALRVPRPAGTRAWTHVTATSHTLAIDADGRLFAWGLNTSGQLGLGPNTPTLSLVPTPTPVPSPAHARWSQVAAGSGFSLGLTTTGELFAWGNNESGQLGIGRLLPRADAPHQVPPPAPTLHWIRLAAGANHALAMTDDTSLYAWGANLYGQAGVFPDPPPPWPGEFLPRRIEWPPNVAEWLAFTGGAGHSLAVADDGRVFRWGKTTALDHHYQLHPVPGATRDVLWNVDPPPATPSFVRHLPSLFAPGQPFTVFIVARPTPSAAAWALEDSPPADWTVTEISDHGLLDLTKGKVKFGPFYDPETRTLSYRAHPPSLASLPARFLGTASIDGSTLPVTGDDSTRPSPLHHPADQPPADVALDIDEVTAYGAAWRRGADWPIEPRRIPIDYVTRAGLIWRFGENYHFDGDASAPPLCWAPGEAPRLPTPGVAQAPGRGVSTRSITAGPPWRVTILVEPAPGTSSHAIEEHLPTSGPLHHASHHAELDPTSQRLRWGPFHDDSSRLLTYELQIPASEAGPWRWDGSASFDGVSLRIGGDTTVPTGSAPPRLAVQLQDDHTLECAILGTTHRGWTLESSTNLTSWTASETLPPGASLLRLPLDQLAGNARRFYRLRASD